MNNKRSKEITDTKNKKNRQKKNGRTLSRVDKSYVYLCWGLPENNLPKTKTGSRVEDKNKKKTCRINNKVAKEQQQKEKTIKHTTKHLANTQNKQTKREKNAKNAKKNVKKN